MSCYLPKLPSFLASMPCQIAPYAEDWPQSDAHKDVIFNMISCKATLCMSWRRNWQLHWTLPDHDSTGELLYFGTRVYKTPTFTAREGWKKLSMHSRKNLSKRFQYFSGNVAKNEPSQLILSTVHGSWIMLQWSTLFACANEVLLN